MTYSTFLAMNADVNPQSLLVDGSGDAYVLSESGGGAQDFLVSPVEHFTNQADLVVQEIDPTGGTELFSTFLGGNGTEIPAGIALDPAGAIYVTGYTNSSDYPVTAAALQGNLGGNHDAFVNKIGTAAAPAVALSPSLIQFSIRPVGSVSQPNTSLLRNMGSAALAMASIVATGDFAVDSNCGEGVAAAATCTFTVTFTPTQPGPRFGSIMIQDDAAGSPHFINLVGNGATAVADLAPASLTFPSLQISQASSAQSVTLTNNGNATLVISGIQITGDYAQTNTCPGVAGDWVELPVPGHVHSVRGRRAQWNGDCHGQCSGKSAHGCAVRQRICDDGYRRPVRIGLRQSERWLDQRGAIDCCDEHGVESNHGFGGDACRRFRAKQQLHRQSDPGQRLVHDPRHVFANAGWNWRQHADHQ